MDISQITYYDSQGELCTILAYGKVSFSWKGISFTDENGELVRIKYDSMDTISNADKN